MSLSFDVLDRMHNIVVKFARTFLPGAKKPYRLKAVHQKELGIHEIASKAEVYNVQVSPSVIEAGLAAGLQVIRYLVADGYRIKTPLFSLKLRIPGWYDGSETHLPEGTFPEARFLASEDFQDYLGKRVAIAIDGTDDTDGFIGKIVDEATGLLNETATIGAFLTVRGRGLKIEADEAHKGEVGLFFVPETGEPVNAPILAVNEPKTLKAVVPAGMAAGAAYTLRVITQSSVKVRGYLLQELREVQSQFALTARP